MALDKERQEEADYLAAKLAEMMKDQRSPGDNRIFYLQVAQFVVTGIVATILAAYGMIIQQHQQAQDALMKEAQQHVQEQETQAAKAKVVLDFMPALADNQDVPKAKIALQAIEKFIDIDFAHNITVIVNTPALKEGLASIQDTMQAKLEPVSAPPSGPAPAQRAGWVYLGDYSGSGWTSRYFSISGKPDLASPQELAAGKPEIGVRADVGAANLRSQPPTSGTRLNISSVLGQVRGGEKWRVDEVQPVPGTSFWWAHVTKTP